MKRFLLIIACILWFSHSAFADVAVNDSGTRTVDSGGGGSPLDLTTFTVSAGSNQCLIALVGASGNSTTLTATWDFGGSAQSMTLETGASSSFISDIRVFRLINPVAGNKTLRFTWDGGTAYGGIIAVNFSGADQSTCAKAADSVNAVDSGTSISFNVTSSSDGATIGFLQSLGGGIASVDSPQTSLGLIGAGVDIGAGYVLGGTTNAHPFTMGGGGFVQDAGVHILAASAAATVGHGLTTLGAGHR